MEGSAWSDQLRDPRPLFGAPRTRGSDWVRERNSKPIYKSANYRVVALSEATVSLLGSKCYGYSGTKPAY